MAMTKDKGKAAEDAKRRAREAKNARVLAEQSLIEMDTKLGGMELKLAEAESLNLAQVNEVAEPRQPWNLVRINGIMWALQMLRILWNPSFTNRGAMGSAKGGWLPYN